MPRVFNFARVGGAVSRRSFAGLFIPGLYAFASRSPRLPLHANEKLEEDANQTLTSLRQEIEIPAPAARIMHALLDDRQFSTITGYAATIDPNEGGAFSVFNGLVTGRNIEIVPGTRLVQAWRPANWDDGVYSLVRFDFSQSEAGSTVVLDHSSFPQGDYDHLAQGWYLRYWQPMRTFFVQQASESK